jgi:RHS repeat-associated protein
MSIGENDGTLRSFQHDSLDRLIKETITQSGPIYEKTFAYDPVGNRTSQGQADPGGTSTISYAYDGRDRLLSAGSNVYSWDENGSLIGRSSDGSVYAYDFDNRLNRINKADGSVVSFTYDADGNRVRAETTSPTAPPQVTDYLIDPSGSLSQVVAELDASGNILAHYVRGAGLIAVNRASQARFYHADGLGSIRLLTDEAGAVTDRYAYSAFGELLSHTGSDPNTYLFAGEQLDRESGLYYLRARWMAPELGSFTAMDPYLGSLRNPGSQHRYQYAAHDPVDYIDPSGKSELNELSFVTAQLSNIASRISLAATSLYLRAVTLVLLTPIWVERFSTWGSRIADGITIGLAGLEFVNLATNALLRNTAEIPAGLGDRGVQIEETAGVNLGGTFPKIDDFRDGVATSVRSHQVSGGAEGLLRAIRRDVNVLNGIENKRLSGVSRFGQRVVINPGEIEAKSLLVAIPEADATLLLNPQLRAALAELSEESEVLIRVVPVKGWR